MLRVTSGLDKSPLCWRSRQLACGQINSQMQLTCGEIKPQMQLACVEIKLQMQPACGEIKEIKPQMQQVKCTLQVSPAASCLWTDILLKSNIED